MEDIGTYPLEDPDSHRIEDGVVKPVRTPEDRSDKTLQCSQDIRQIPDSIEQRHQTTHKTRETYSDNDTPEDL